MRPGPDPFGGRLEITQTAWESDPKDPILGLGGSEDHCHTVKWTKETLGIVS